MENVTTTNVYFMNVLHTNQKYSLPPVKTLIASPNASIDSISKLFVGSSWDKEKDQDIV